LGITISRLTGSEKAVAFISRASYLYFKELSLEAKFIRVRQARASYPKIKRCCPMSVDKRKILVALMPLNPVSVKNILCNLVTLL